MTTLADPAVEHAAADRVERALAGHQDFGRSGPIARRVVARYEFLVDLLVARLPGLAAPAAELRADRDRWERLVLADPVVKRTLEDAVVRLELDEPIDELPRVFALAAGRPAARPDLPPTRAEEADGAGDGIWVPRMRAGSGPLTDRMDAAFRGEFLTYDDKSGTVYAGDPATARRLEPAAELLRELLPVLGPDVLGHVAAVVLVDAAGPRGRLLSASGGDGLPGVVALAPSQLADPWDTAGRLLHEGLHLKLFDVMRCFSLVADPSASATMPWRDVPWDLQRVLAAFHVYSHMVLYGTAVRRHRGRLADRFGEPGERAAVSHSTGGRPGFDDAAARARHLGEELAGPLARYLTPDGRRLVRWLRLVTAPLTGA
ncbi:MAG TPA: HEXXH motif-containing putative peptide modification protein, partial [Pseudonocardiaceae bacterium]